MSVRFVVVECPVIIQREPESVLENYLDLTNCNVTNDSVQWRIVPQLPSDGQGISQPGMMGRSVPTNAVLMKVDVSKQKQTSVIVGLIEKMYRFRGMTDFALPKSNVSANDSLLVNDAKIDEQSLIAFNEKLNNTRTSDSVSSIPLGVNRTDYTRLYNFKRAGSE